MRRDIMNVLIKIMIPRRIVGKGVKMKSEEYNDYLLALTIFLSLNGIVDNLENKENIPYGIYFGINEGMKLVEKFRKRK